MDKYMCENYHTCSRITCSVSKLIQKSRMGASASPEDARGCSGQTNTHRTAADPGYKNMHHWHNFKVLHISVFICLLDRTNAHLR